MRTIESNVRRCDAVIACVPCGHTWCARCLQDAGGACIECGDGGHEAPPSPVKVGPLGTLVSKFAFQKQALSALAVSAANNASVAGAPSA